MSKIKVIIIVLASALSLLFAFSYHNKIQNKRHIRYYLPQLKNYKIFDVEFRLIYADPGFMKPYDVLIAFKSDNLNIAEDIGLKQLQKIDTISLRSTTWFEEYKVYFTLYSINSIRYKSMEREEKKVKWWKIELCKNNYAAPYFDFDKERRIVNFGNKNNGRVACCKVDNTYYILIECWG